MKRFLLAFTMLRLAACAPPEDNTPLFDADDVGEDGKADTWSTAINGDNLNGLWTTTVDGQALPAEVVIDSWPEIGVRIHMPEAVYNATLTGTELDGDALQLTLAANKKGVSDDSIDGSINGRPVHMVRSTKIQPTSTLQLPADRPYRAFLVDLLAPAAQRDRESYATMHYADMLAFFNNCELYKHGAWPRQFMKGATLTEQYASFKKIISAMDKQVTSPHAIIHNAKFVNAIQANLKDPSVGALAMSTLGMYFSTAGGRSVHLPITSDSMAYFITDRATRSERIGVVAMKTPLHGTLASTFGRQLLDFAAMPAADNTVYARTMMEMLVKSDAHRASTLSPAGRSALTDWFAVMAIEDYRGVAFGNPDLGWGYNMTEVQFYGLVTRALARPAEKDSAGNAVVAQVIVGTQLQPGDASYADVLNGGNDMQEYPDMSQLKILATEFLREQHPQAITNVQNAFAGVVPANQADWRAQQDIFHFVAQQIYDSQGRWASLKGAVADNAINSVVALIDTLNNDSARFEQFILAHGIVKSSTPAPKSTGF